MKPGYLLLVLLISALLISASGCESGEYKAIELVPAESNLIASIQVSKIVNDQDIRDAYDEMEKDPDQPRTFDEALDKLLKDSGMDVNDVSHALIFGNVSDVAQNEYVGFIAEGTFNESDFIENIEEKTGDTYAASDYKGHKLYASGKEDYSLTFLNDNMLLGGSTRAVKDSIDVSKGESQPAGGQLLDAYNRYGNALISLAVKTPENAPDTFADDPIMSEMPISMDAFSSIDIVGFSLDKKDETLDSRLEFHFLEVDSLQDARDTISGMISMFKGMMEDPELKEFLGNIEVSVSGSWMTIAFEIELFQIEDLMEMADTNSMTGF